MRPAIKATIDRLLAQYHEYMVLDTLCRDAKSAYEKRVLQLATERSLTPTQVMDELVDADAMLLSLARQRDRYVRMRDRVSDEMTFPTPEIWMRYKALAYKDSPSEIATWGAFKQHCSPSGYICTRRYAFLQQEVERRYSVDLNAIASEMSLLEACDASWLQKVEENTELIDVWQQQEFYRTDNRVAKWEDSV